MINSFEYDLQENVCHILQMKVIIPTTRQQHLKSQDKDTYSF